MELWSEFIWLRTAISGELVENGKEILGFIKKKRIS
jgi:hypothetical protein